VAAEPTATRSDEGGSPQGRLVSQFAAVNEEVADFEIDEQVSRGSAWTWGQTPSGFASRMPWAASPPALVALPLRMKSNPTATMAPSSGPTR
jgi:hypothetical protein